VLALGGVSAERPFLDPMAGSGTLAIEHALAARVIAPGLQRRFGFQRWATHEQLRIWTTLVKAAREAVLPRPPCPIVARDIDRSAIGTAQRNADAAGVLRDITFEVGDIASLPTQAESGTLCTNPPYGERLLPDASGSDVQRLYARMAQSIAPLAGWRAVILAGNPAILRALGRKPVISHRLWNGPLEARLLVFEL
jgi:23S rRNA G2445 N2-methylase RlmL